MAASIPPRPHTVWARGPAEFTDVRAPEVGETTLSREEVRHGIRSGIFDIPDDDGVQMLTNTQSQTTVQHATLHIASCVWQLGRLR